MARSSSMTTDAGEPLASMCPQPTRGATVASLPMSSPGDPTHFSRHLLSWVLVAVFSLVLAACGGPSSPTIADKSGVATKGVIDKTGASSSAPVANVKAVPGTKKLPGSVCALLTTAEVDAVTKLNQPLSTAESGGGDEDRVCNYVVGGVGSVLAVTLQGEREPEDWSAVKSIPGILTIEVRGAEARFLPLNNVAYVNKNGLTAALLIVVTAPGETPQTATTKLAQVIANRLP